MKIQVHGPLPTTVVDHGALTGAEPTLEDLQNQQLQLQNRIVERKRIEQAQQKAQEAQARQTKAGEAALLFDDLADELCQKWQRFRQLHLEACELFGELAAGAGSLGELYNVIVQARGLPQPDLLSQVQRLCEAPNPLRDLLADDWATPVHVGYNWQVAVVPLKKIRGKKNG